MTFARAGLARLLPALAGLVLATSAAAQPQHGLSMYGDLKYGPDFEHFDYVNPAAPKGGALVSGVVGSFDSLNPFILRGTPGAVTGTFETLTEQSLDEPFSEYGLLAESVEMPEDRSYVRFNLRPEARFSDGRPVTAEDVIWTFNTLITEGNPTFRYYYANVAKAEQTGERQVTFTFDGGVNRELPLIMGQLPVLPKHHFEGRAFDEPTLEVIPGSGPYVVERVDPGRSITLRRNPDYWGKDLPINRGRDNADELRYEYFRDSNVALQAFKAGVYDLRAENTASLWATAYTGPAFDRGLIVKEEIPRHDSGVMQGFAYNIRRPIFQDPKVRRALAYAFDFEWTNANLFYGEYERVESYFSGTELASTGLPEGEELALLEPYRDQLPPEVFTETYQAPKSDGSGNIRDNLRAAFQLLTEAGWTVENGVLTNQATGDVMRFEILLGSPAFERIVQPFVRNLERLGVQASIRTVDPAQYQNRTDDFDFDMTVDVWGQSLSPGNEQRDFWGSAAADQPGSRNTVGIKDPVVDALIQKIITAPSREALVTATHALDRVLLWGHYVIPNWRSPTVNLAYWSKLRHPTESPNSGFDLSAWWVDTGREVALESEKQQLPASQ
ncbi:extracellular solute-binding protein [Marinivivus vitaminiproducens]|uniref:extracellular solute-binding protein n=1 Tax=Marinivivus vitaminiproducens TaxID=3035935 RepID=UPI00279E1D49|nr:extracellular solute-binding protein [Geminicoccaceae bacterium SCSIO 64248]